MPLYRTIKESNYSVYIWHVTEPLENFVSELPEIVIEQILKNNKLQKRMIEKSVQAKLLILAKIDPLLISYTSSGKPFILKMNKNISISHSGEYAALIVSRSICGIDIEKTNPKIERISQKFLNESEKHFLTQPDAINWIWSIKEAVFKYFGSHVFFKEDILIDRLNMEQLTAIVIYKGFHGVGKFEMNLKRFGNYYLAYTKAYHPS
jgi:phosphopantetheinyl transferase